MTAAVRSRGRAPPSSPLRGCRAIHPLARPAPAADFDALLSTVALLLGRSPLGAARFVTAYQHRSGHRSLHVLLDRWALRCASVVAAADVGDLCDGAAAAGAQQPQRERIEVAEIVLV